MSFISSIEHGFAAAASFVVQESKVLSSKVLPVLKSAKAEESTIEAITGLINPSAVNIERAAFAALGTIIKAIEDGSAAGAAGGVNLTLDAQFVADIKTIIPTVKATLPQVAPATK